MLTQAVAVRWLTAVLTVIHSLMAEVVLAKRELFRLRPRASALISAVGAWSAILVWTVTVRRLTVIHAKRVRKLLSLLDPLLLDVVLDAPVLVFDAETRGQLDARCRLDCPVVTLLVATDSVATTSYQYKPTLIAQSRLG